MPTQGMPLHLPIPFLLEMRPTHLRLVPFLSLHMYTVGERQPPPPTVDFEGMMSVLQRMELNMTTNTQALERLERRVDTIYDDQRLGTIAQAGPHPSWYTWNPAYGGAGESGRGTGTQDPAADDSDSDSMAN